MFGRGRSIRLQLLNVQSYHLERYLSSAFPLLFCFLLSAFSVQRSAFSFLLFAFCFLFSALDYRHQSRLLYYIIAQPNLTTRQHLHHKRYASSKVNPPSHYSPPLKPSPVGSLSVPTDDITPKPQNKIVHLVRHAQGFHNLSYKKHSILDPLLTPKGLTQCGHVSATFSAAQQSSIKLLAASPLRRTIYTALYSFPDVVKRGLKILALPEAQETGAEPCDTGSDREALEKEFETLPVDLSQVHEGWNLKTGRWATDTDAVRERALFVRRWLRDIKEDVICLVSHGGFLHYLNEDWDGFKEAKGTGWANCEWRTYEFKAGVGEGDENASLVETKGSRARRSDSSST